MPPKATPFTPEILTNADVLRPFATLLPPIKTTDEKLAQLAIIMRTTTAVCLASHENVSSYILLLLNEAEKILNNYDTIQDEAIKQHSRITYIKVYVGLLGTKLDKEFQHIKKLKSLTRESKVKYAEFQKINAKIKSLYQQMEETFRSIQAFIKAEKSCPNELLSEFKIGLYQTYADALIYKAHALNIETKKDLRALGIQSLVDSLHELTTEINKPNLSMNFLLLKIRFESQINGDTTKALSVVDQLKTMLLEYSAANPLNPENLKKDYTNQVVLAELGIYSYQFDLNATRPPEQSLLKKAVDTALNAIDSIDIASDNHKAEMSWIINRVLSLSINRIKFDVCFDTSEQLAEKIIFAESLKKLFPLLNRQTMKSVTSIGDNPADLYEGTINNLITSIKNKMTALQETMASNEKEFDLLRKREAEYGANFQKTLGQFQTKPKKPTNHAAKPSLPLPKTSSPNKDEHQEKNPIGLKKENETAISQLAIYAEQYFKTVGLGGIETLLDQVDDHDYPEAMLYIGDFYLKRNFINEALFMYESAFHQSQLHISPNEDMIDGIKMRLEEAQNKLEKYIEKAEDDRAKLEQSRTNLIIKFGMRALQQAGAPKEQLNFKNQTCWDTIYKRGLEIFQSIGEKKKQAGVPLSAETQIRDQIDFYLGLLTNALDRSHALISSIDANKSKVNFPPLSKNTSSMFHAASEKPKKENNPVNHTQNQL